LKADRHITLIHLGILVAHRNGNKEEEWPNFEFFPKTDNPDYIMRDSYTNKIYIKPFLFKKSIYEILKELHPDKENEMEFIEILYKKKALPSMNPKIPIMKGIKC
jgi:hypothetical protein